jgi:AcrR family transcriptional regulator
MSPDTDRPTVAAASVTESKPATRVRPKPGERRLQILQMLATMLQEPGGERVTTAALAARLAVSEAALYRHFASKAQMFEGLIEFIEQSLFGLINQIVAQEPDARRQLRSIVQMLLGGRYTVGELAEACEIPSHMASEHLRLMQRCGFLDMEKEGRCVYYTIAEPHLASIMACIEARFGSSKQSRTGVSA